MREKKEQADKHPYKQTSKRKGGRSQDRFLPHQNRVPRIVRRFQCFSNVYLTSSHLISMLSIRTEREHAQMSCCLSYLIILCCLTIFDLILLHLILILSYLIYSHKARRMFFYLISFYLALSRRYSIVSYLFARCMKKINTLSYHTSSYLDRFSS